MDLRFGIDGHVIPVNGYEGNRTDDLDSLQVLKNVTGRVDNSWVLMPMELAVWE